MTHSKNKSVGLDLPFTVNDFPPEIIETFLHRFEPKAISTLKLVSKKFRSVFKQDKFYKAFLIYPEEFLYDLEALPKTQDVQVIADNIKNGIYGKYEGSLRIQKAHLANLRGGKFNTVDTIYVPSKNKKINTVCEMNDKNSGRWLCCLFESGEITLINYMTKQEINFKLEFEEIHFLNGLILLEKGDYRFSVYKLIGQEGSCTLQMSYESNFLEEFNIAQSPHSWIGFQVVSEKRRLCTEGEKDFLVFLVIRNNMGTICLWNLENNSKSIVTLGDSALKGASSPFSVQSFPNLLLNLTYFKIDGRLYNKALVVFNVEAKRVTHVLDISFERSKPDIFEIDVGLALGSPTVRFLTSNVISIEFASRSGFYTLSPILPNNLGIFILFALHDFEFDLRSMLLFLYFFSSKSVCIFQDDELITHFTSSESQFKTNIFKAPRGNLIGFYPPDIMLMKSYGNEKTKNIVRGVTLSGQRLFSWNAGECDKIQIKHCPPRVILHGKSRNCQSFKIYYF